MTDISPQYIHFKTSGLCHQDVYRRLAAMRKALSDLRQKSKKDVLEDTTFWHQEIKKVKEENDQILSSRQECERLQEQLMKAEQKADELNLLLNQKLIELNKLQINFSKQTKEMIELEKSYIQLQCRMRRGVNKQFASRLFLRASPFSSKNLFPKPSPPASPGPSP